MGKSKSKTEKTSVSSSKKSITKKKHEDIVSTELLPKSSSSSIEKKSEKPKSSNGNAGIKEIDDLFASAAKTRKEDREKKEEIQRQKDQKFNSSGGKRGTNLKYDRSDLSHAKKGEWISDGLGGKFNSDGYTGRKEGDSGYKIYKAHLFNKKGAGQTKDCPFDCDCCFI